MVTPLLRTKLYIPSARSELVPRPHLAERLDAALDYKLTLVSAPAGFGKTTLLSEWIHSRVKDQARKDEPSTAFHPSKVAWISLDRGDNDLGRFLTYFFTAVQMVDADVGNTALAALQSAQHPPVEALLAGLINEIIEIPRPLIVVLDDYHVITEQRIHDALAFLLDNLPSQMHLMLASRADPPWPLARMRVRREVVELRADDLRFTLTEVTAFLNDVMGLELAPQDITALDSRTEGWIAGLQLAALSMQGRLDTAAFVQAFSGSHRFVLDYLAEEVLSRQSADVQEFLLKTSILERMTAPLCDTVTGMANSQDILIQLGRDNLFLIPLDDERRWYRYHRLFGDLLRSRLQETQLEHVPNLYRRASEWCEETGLVEEAVTYALTGQDMERAATLIERNAMQMIVQGEIMTVSWWLDALPDDLVRVRAWLSVYRAWTQYWVGHREQAEECLRDAEQVLQDTPAPSKAEGQRIAGHIAVIRAYNALVYEELSQVLEMAQRALDLLSEGEYMRSMAALILGGAHWGLGNVVAAQRAFTEASTTAQKCGYPFLAVSAACYAGIQQAKQAQLYEARDTYRAALELATENSGRELPASGFALVRLGDLSREWNDLETARRDLAKGVELCAQWGQVDIQADGYIALARLQLAQADWEQAANTIQKADQLVHSTKPDPWITCWLDDCRLRLWLSVGDLAAAVRWARASGLRVDGELCYPHDLHHINLARVLVAQGAQQPSGPYLDEALALLARLLEAAETAGWTNETIKVLILQALALEARGDSDEALFALSHALALAEPGGYVRTFIDEGALMAKLLSQIIVTRSNHACYARKLLAALEGGTTVAQQPTISLLPLVEPLSERELQVLRLLTTNLSSTEIAQELFVAKSTVRTHIKNIYQKLDVHRRTDAVQRAQELGLL